MLRLEVWNIPQKMSSSDFQIAVFKSFLNKRLTAGFWLLCNRDFCLDNEEYLTWHGTDDWLEFQFRWSSENFILSTPFGSHISVDLCNL